MSGAIDTLAPGVDGSVLDGDWDPDAHWSTTNVSEAMPGVPTPLSWTLWRPVFERTMRGAFAALGAMERSRTADPADPYERMLGIFSGRVAAKVEFLGEMGDRLPGTTGAAIAEQFMGELPPDFVSANTARRYPVIAGRLPVAAVRAPRHVRRVHDDTGLWWSERLAVVDQLSLGEARAAWADAARGFERAFFVHVLTNLVTVQPVYDQVLRLAARSGRSELGGRLLAGQGSHAELIVVEDCWALSRHRLTLEAFLSRHGYHGPGEGELSSLVWREDPKPVEALCDLYRGKPDSDSPSALQRRLAVDAARARQELLAALPRTQRPGARLILAAASRYMGLRGIGKAAFVQALDVARATARRFGTLLAEGGAIAAPDDVFSLTAEELGHVEAGESVRGLVARRQAERAGFQARNVPLAWHGRPETVPVGAPGGSGAGEIGLRLTGIGASPGVVEGRVRIVDDPALADLAPGEILVAETTDPAWAAVMFASAGLDRRHRRTAQPRRGGRAGARHPVRDGHRRRNAAAAVW